MKTAQINMCLPEFARNYVIHKSNIDDNNPGEIEWNNPVTLGQSCRLGKNKMMLKKVFH